MNQKTPQIIFLIVWITISILISIIALSTGGFSAFPVLFFPIIGIIALIGTIKQESKTKEKKPFNPQIIPGLCMLFFGIMWTSITSTTAGIFINLIKVEKDPFLIIPVIMISLFVFIGVGLIFFAIRIIITAKNSNKQYINTNHKQSVSQDDVYGHAEEDFFVRYCPYCGENMTRYQNKCPSCGGQSEWKR